MSYGQSVGNSIGSLLRFIQEQKSQSPMVPPSTETGSPIRAMTQQPLLASESVGTSHVASIKPESVLAPGQTQSAIGPIVQPESIPFPTPVPTPTMPPSMNMNRPSQPSVPSSMPSSSVASAPIQSKPTVQTPTKKITMPTLSTKLLPTSSYVAPSRIGNQPIVGTPQTTPTPAPKQGETPKGGWLDSIMRSVYDKLFKPFGGKAYA